jgi:exonuclease III
MWNVRGLNTRAHHDAVRQLVLSEAIFLVCLQETKHESISDYDVIQLVGTGFDSFLIVAQTHGGILVAWHSSSWVATGSSYRPFSV